jgi:ribokinase
MSKIAVIGLVGNSAFLSVDKFHEGGETIHARSVHFEPGGKGYNQAVAAARYGAAVSFLGAVGKDGYESIRAFSEAEGIEAMLVKKQDATAFAAIITNAEGANQVTVYPGARLDAADVSLFERQIAEADVLLINNEVPEEVNVRAVEIAKANGTRVILNPAPARKTSPYILENVSLFTPNEHETEGLEKKANLVVTLGAKGCLLKETGETVPAVHVGDTVDTTGAGDTFNGVLAVMLAEGATLREAAERASIASGIGVTRKFAASSIPTKADIDRHL